MLDSSFWTPLLCFSAEGKDRVDRERDVKEQWQWLDWRGFGSRNRSTCSSGISRKRSSILVHWACFPITPSVCLFVCLSVHPSWWLRHRLAPNGKKLNWTETKVHRCVTQLWVEAYVSRRLESWCAAEVLESRQ